MPRRRMRAVRTTRGAAGRAGTQRDFRRRSREAVGRHAPQRATVRLKPDTTYEVRLKPDTTNAAITRGPAEAGHYIRHGKTRLSGQCEDVHGVRAACDVGLWSRLELRGGDRATTGGDGDVLSAVHRERDR